MNSFTYPVATEILENAIDHYGEEYQVLKAIEELSELIVELAKRQNELGLRIHLLGEIADASIMIEQLKLIFGRNEVEGLINQKLERLKNRMTEDEAYILSGAV